MAAEGDVALGFEGIEDKDDPKSYTVQFSPSDPDPTDAQPLKTSEEIVLLERSSTSPERPGSSKEEKV